MYLRGQFQFSVNDVPLGSNTGGQLIGGHSDGQLSPDGDSGSVNDYATGLGASINLSPVGKGTSTTAWEEL